MKWVLIVVLNGSMQGMGTYPSVELCMNDAVRWQEQQVVAVCQKAQDPNEIYANMEFHMKKMLKLVNAISKDAGE